MVAYGFKKFFAQRLLKRGGVDAHSRIRREQKLAILTAQQIQIERRLGIGEPRP